ncbi:hypothetical protein HDU86_001584 [Geranomyces michiganensis]|nr:hypothetical protein HDU86_001584 [Geranomyces michiganensis]
MNVIKSFSVKALSRNLAVGNGSSQALPRVKHIGVVFGSDDCIAKPALSSFYVNELPRLHNSNPHITFTTAPEEAENCSITLGLDDGKTVAIDLRECCSSAALYKRILAESAATPESVEPPLAA